MAGHELNPNYVTAMLGPGRTQHVHPCAATKTTSPLTFLGGSGGLAPPPVPQVEETHVFRSARPCERILVRSAL
jgi:hypothetical protein